MPVLAEPKIGFREAVKDAFENNNEFRAFRDNLAAIKKDIGIERSKLLPNLNFEEAFASTNNPAGALTYKLEQSRITPADLAIAELNHPKPVSNFLTGIYLEQPVFDRKLNINLSIAKTEFSSQTFEYLRKWDELVNKVALAYSDVDKNLKLVSAAQKDVEETQENLDAIQLKLNNKKDIYSSVLRATTALVDIKQLLVSAKADLKIFKRALGLVLGKCETVDIIEDAFKDLPFKEECYYNNASLGRNDIKSLELKYENAKNDIKLAAADYLPKIGIAGSYEFYSANAPFGGHGNNYLASAFVRWEMFDGLRRRNEKSKAQDKAMEACENLEGFKKDVSYQVFAAYSVVEAKKENWRLAEEALKTAKEARDHMLIRYKKSNALVVDLLLTQTNLNMARINSIIQENNYINALINISFASGTILKDLNIV